MFGFFKSSKAAAMAYGGKTKKWYIEYKNGEEYILMQKDGQYKRLPLNLCEVEFNQAVKEVGDKPSDAKWLRYTELNRRATSFLARKTAEEKADEEEKIRQHKELVKSSLKEMVESGEFKYDPVKGTLVKGSASVVSDAELFFPRQEAVPSPLGSVRLSEELVTHMGKDKFIKLLNEAVITLKTNNDGMLLVGDYNFVLTDDEKYLPSGQEKLPIIVGRKVSSPDGETDWNSVNPVESDRVVMALLEEMETRLTAQESKK